MRLRLIACEVFVRELCYLTAQSPHVFDLTFLPFGLHDTPDQLRVEIQRAVDSCEEGPWEGILLGYALCSRGSVGITARSLPLVIPRAHDCITLLLGSRDRYNREFSGHPGTYYYSPGWAERKDGEVAQGTIQDTKSTAYRARFEEYVEKYGEDNARFLLEQETHWLDHYNRAVFLNTGLGDVEGYRAFTRRIAEQREWEHAEIPGGLSLLRRLVWGPWDTPDFLQVQPGQTVVESFDEQVLAARD